MAKANHDSITLTEREIQARSASTVFDRGRRLYENGALSSLVRRGDQLSARCQGSMPEPYRVWARFFPKPPYLAICNCEYGGAGECKHVVAMLLAYLREPDLFARRKPRREELMPLKKADLVELIEEMILRYPDLEDLLERAPVDSAAPQTLDLRPMQRDLKQAFASRGPWPDRSAEYKVYELAEVGENYAERGEYIQAVAVYCAILEVCNASELPDDDEGTYIEAVNYTVACLSEALTHVDIMAREDLRKRVVDALVNAVLWDIDFGGIDYGYGAYALVGEYAQPGDAPAIRQQLRQLEEANKRNGYAGGWSSEAIEVFLMMLDMLDGTDPNETIKRLQDKELHVLYAGVMLKMEQVDEAAAAIAKLRDKPDFRRGLDLLVEHQHVNRAIGLAEAALDNEYKRLTANWLINCLRQQGDDTAELRWQRARMREDPHIDHYATLRKAAEATGDWQTIRAEVISHLRQTDAWAVLTLAHLHDEAWDLAWEALDKAVQRKGVAYWDLDFTVAEQSRHVRPARAIPVYIKYARGEINRKQRKDYAIAAKRLSEVRKLYQQMEDDAGWQKLIANLRAEFKRLPALQDELNKAGL